MHIHALVTALGMSLNDRTLERMSAGACVSGNLNVEG